MKSAYQAGSKSAYYQEGLVGNAFEAIGFIHDHKNATENRLLFKPIGGKLVAYIGVPYTEFHTQADSNFHGFETYFKSVVLPTYREVPYA
ncbi:MAG: hypothetical protein Q8Q76_12085 [Methylotenera sp.]|nr:hypothetical protein [Methylotenera sp.]MDP3745059.1 hypothetical protein [Methylotenera sp.]